MVNLAKYLLGQIEDCSDCTQIELALSRFLTRDSVIQLIDDCLRYPNPIIEQYAQKSYIHANGFEKLVIASNSNIGSQIRIHRWLGNLSTSHIHDHSWHFASVILKGELRADDYLIADGDDLFDMHSVPNLVSRERGMLPSTVEKSLSIQRVKVRNLLPGDIHGLSAGKFHSVQSLDEIETATLLFQSKHEVSSSRIVMHHGGSLENPYVVKRLGVESFKASLRDVRIYMASEFRGGVPGNSLGSQVKRITRITSQAEGLFPENE